MGHSLNSVCLSLCSDDELEVSTLRERALSLSLRYNFVTELTSLIVVQETNSGNFTLEGDLINLDSTIPLSSGIASFRGKTILALCIMPLPPMKAVKESEDYVFFLLFSDASTVGIIVGCVIAFLVVLGFVLIPFIVAMIYTRTWKPKKGNEPITMDAGAIPLKENQQGTTFEQTTAKDSKNF